MEERAEVGGGRTPDFFDIARGGDADDTRSTADDSSGYGATVRPGRDIAIGNDRDVAGRRERKGVNPVSAIVIRPVYETARGDSRIACAVIPRVYATAARDVIGGDCDVGSIRAVPGADTFLGVAGYRSVGGYIDGSYERTTARESPYPVTLPRY